MEIYLRLTAHHGHGLGTGTAHRHQFAADRLGHCHGFLCRTRAADDQTRHSRSWLQHHGLIGPQHNPPAPVFRRQPRQCNCAHHGLATDRQPDMYGPVAAFLAIFPRPVDRVDDPYAAFFQPGRVVTFLFG